ncbi:MAG: hypothetical protein EPN92_03145 [Chitinophagaceae bacterium]|nr:MAG: hypothetical protein EPN92_03145 [Chitinophagaceae bacterium]
MKKAIIFPLVGILVITSCSKSGSSYGGSYGGGGGGGGTTSCTGVPNKFAADVNPIIQSTCATNSGCHGAGSPNGPGELLTYTQIYNARVNIRSAVSSGTMPKTGSLSTAQKNSIICWIDSGAPNN